MESPQRPIGHPTRPAFYVPAVVDLGHAAWVQHTPFMAALMVALQPRTFVELGVHTGNSYFAACEAVERFRLQTKCFAVDTWQGDEHAGFYGSEVFDRVSVMNKRFNFSELLQMRFDEAATQFEEDSIDLIHFDGRHFYSDVQADLDLWAPKLTGNGVALFHDIHVYNHDFGVSAFWASLRSNYQTFEFFHGNGLGVAIIGSRPSEEFLRWFEALESEANQNREAYYRLGEAVLDHHRLLDLEKVLLARNDSA